MSAKTLVWSFACVASFALGGCALTLDYGPPSTMDGSVADTGTGCSGSCDDGLRCTADSCTAGACQHTDTCTGHTDCVSRGGMGECRRACTSNDECADANPCTDDVCDPADQHCAHPSNCDAATPTCLDTGACVPTQCTTDAECDDLDDCNGTEVCTSGTCRGGTVVTCAAGTGCMHDACDPAVGRCVQILDHGSCDDTYSCTSDVCHEDGSCTHLASNLACATSDRCTTSTCDPPMSHDATGCAVNASTGCPTACGVMGMCDSATGACTYEGACATGQVCLAGGCMDATCNDAGDCHGVHTTSGCQTVCAAGHCVPPACTPPRIGSCARTATSQCTTGVCNLVADSMLCDDGDPASTDVCDPAAYTCSHTCPTLPPGCLSYVYAGGSCQLVRNDGFCAAAHGPSGTTDCARSACRGPIDIASGDDGCRFVAVDLLCSDTIGCTSDTCSLSASGAGTCAHAASTSTCDDAMDCTTDGCDPSAMRGTSGCTHTVDDAMCAAAVGTLPCATGYCAQTGTLGNTIGGRTLPTGCAVRYAPSSCAAMTGQICTLDGRCTSVPCSGSGVGMCDDGVACNGREICNVPTGHCVQDTLASPCPGSGTSCQQVCVPSGCAPPQTIMCGVIAMTD